MWMTTLGEFRKLMEHRAQLLIRQPLTKHEHSKTVPLPHRVEDEYHAPPVVVWLGPWLPKERAGGKTSEPVLRQRSVRQRWAASSQASWSQQRWRLWSGLGFTGGGIEKELRATPRERSQTWFDW